MGSSWWKETARRPGKARDVGIIRVMAVALDGSTLSRVQTALGKVECSLAKVEDGSRALEDLCFQEYQLVICNYPLPHLLLRHFLQRLRHSSCASRNCSLMVLAIPELLSGASRFIGRGASAVLPRWVPQAELGQTVQRLLEVPERFQPSPKLRVRLQNPDGSPIPTEGVVNLSVNGLLVSSTARPMIGTTIKALISHPDLGEPLVLPGRVTRHTAPDREHVEGFAMSFPGRDLESVLEFLTGTSH